MTKPRCPVCDGPVDACNAEHFDFELSGETDENTVWQLKPCGHIFVQKPVLHVRVIHLEHPRERIKMFRFWFRTGPHSGLSTGLTGLAFIGLMALIVYAALAVGFIALVVIIAGAFVGGLVADRIKARRKAREEAGRER